MVVARWLVAVVLVSACGAAVPPLPGHGGPAWFEIKSEHFTLWTDATVERGHALVRAMEHHRQVITRAMNNAPSNARSFVIALRDAREVAAYLPRDAIASAWEAGGPNREAGIVLSASARDREHVFTHELTHVISFSIIKNQPHWLSEGIATYFEMAELDPGEASVKIGIPREDRAGYLHGSPPLPIPELFACHDHACIDEAFYATSWAVVSLLLNLHFDQLTRYFQRLNALPADRQDQAWRDAFPDLPPGALDRELAEWLISGRVHLPRIAVEIRDYPATDRRLGDGDALAARGLLQLIFHQDAAATSRELTAALAVDPTNVLARLVEAALMRAVPLADARATAAAHPDDWRAWWLVGFALQRSTDADAVTARAAAIARMCALTGESDACARQAAHPN